MTLIHMETECVEYTLQQLQRTLFEMETCTRQLQRTRSRLRDAWKGGPTSQDFLNILDDKLRKLEMSRAQLELLEERLSYELREWVQAGSSLAGTRSALTSAHPQGVAVSQIPTYSVESIRGEVCGVMSDGDKSRCEGIWSHPPTNAEQLAFMIMSLPASMPIVILNIGEGEYLVLMRGTTSGADEGTNWGSAGEAMFVNSSYQNSMIQALNAANLPGGAKLHFAGHSQGGMIAQNLAVDPRVLNRFDVETVTMYGSPDTMASANPNVKYVSFEAPGDLVPKLDEAVMASLYSDGQSVIAGQFHDVTKVAEHHLIVNNLDAWNPNPFVSHSVYDNPGVLEGYNIPFQAKTWESVITADSQVSTPLAHLYNGGAHLYKGIVGTKDAAVHLFKRAIDIRVY